MAVDMVNFRPLNLAKHAPGEGAKMVKERQPLVPELAWKNNVAKGCEAEAEVILAAGTRMNVSSSWSRRRGELSRTHLLLRNNAGELKGSCQKAERNF